MTTTPQRGDWSPWGAIQEAAEVAPGLHRVHTASHGGLHLDGRLRELLPATFTGCREWHEEDCHAPMVAWYLGTTADYCDLPNLDALGFACERMAAHLATAASGMKRHGWGVASAGCRATADRWATFKTARLCPVCGNRRAASGVCHHRDCRAA